MRCIVRLVLIGFALGSSLGAQASLLFDFEAPTYTGSALPGTSLLVPSQDGWYNPNLDNDAFVATTGGFGLTVPLAGQQSVITNYNGSNFALPFHKAAGAGFADGSVFSALIQPNSDLTLLAVSVGANGDGYASVRFVLENGEMNIKALTWDGVSEALLPNIGTYIPGNIYNVSMALNFTDQSYTITIDDLTSESTFTTAPFDFRIYLPFNPDGIVSLEEAEAGDIVFGTINAGNSVFDNIAVVSPVTAQPGDFDNDGDVDGADFVVWQTNFPTADGAMLDDGDADGDGDVDGADFVVWQTNFPTTPGAGVMPVPEPASALLALGGLVVVAYRRRRLCES